MDEDSLADFVSRSALALRAIWPIEKRWDYLVRLHAGLVSDLRARRLDRDLAIVHADMVIEAVLEALADVGLLPQMPVAAAPGFRFHPRAIPAAGSA